MKSSQLIILGAIAALAMCFVLIQSSAAQNSEKDICGMEEHTHDASCFGDKLICGLDESEPGEEAKGHTHSTECYEPVLICPIPEHKHYKSCLPEGNPMALSPVEPQTPSGVGLGDEADIALSDNPENSYLLNKKTSLPEPGIQVEKTSIYDKTNETIVYTVDVTAFATPEAVPPLTVRVMSLTGMPWLEDYDSIANITESTSAYKDFRYSVNGGRWHNVSAFPAWTDAEGGDRARFNYTFLDGGVALEPGQNMKVEFKLDLQQLILGNSAATGDNRLQYDFSVGSEVLVTGNYGSDSCAVTDRASRMPVKKTATYYKSTEKITYKVAVTAPSCGLTVTDFLDQPLIDNSGLVFSDTSNPAFSNFQYRVGNGVLTSFSSDREISSGRLAYTFPGGVTLGMDETLTITYDLDIRELIEQNLAAGRTLMQYNFNLGNAATLKTNLGSGSAGTQTNVSKDNPVKMTAAYNKTAGSITYIVRVSVPSGGDALTVDSFTDAANIDGVKLSAASNSAFSDFRYKLDSGSWNVFTPVWDAADSRFTHAFAPTLTVNAGQMLTIEYTLDLRALAGKNSSIGSALEYGFIQGNSVTIGTDLGSGTAEAQTNVKTDKFMSEAGI